ncbi:type I restriction endonuclease subunit R [Helicobacter felis]|uniref:Type I restriction enzyme endonuclease subunit n=1 Tax=Helicobacter felis (strain ATCC 49179 / CCUG 28539 / NCTC 12436 / CS1) TaxID=936155 RepID=E7ABB5_HELFC|nr:type I restriction endonuclease subunit R [Helicobacter felis]CBY83673.1 Type I restriction enzyme R protein [Helicobacter felis ATCC 49179]
MSEQSTLEKIAQGDLSTVVASKPANKARATTYQKEAELEAYLIEQLQAQGYTLLKPATEESLKANLKTQIERLNALTFSDREWARFTQQINPRNATFIDKTRMLQHENSQSFKFDNGDTKNIQLLDKRHIHNNYLQVIQQYPTPGKEHRYDVSILVNGLPLVHIELKKRGVQLKEAFSQIRNYHKTSMDAPGSLFGFVQIFVISNGTQTKYYSNTTASDTSKDSYKFTSFWADKNNEHIGDLQDFIPTFFDKHTLLSLLLYYCVCTSESKLLAMRPYQVVAVEEILKQVVITHHNKNYGKPKNGGFVWHTTGSGKTLTSFKLAQLAGRLDFISKVVFVVDRKDLDHQTMKEYERYQKNSASSNKNTKTLQLQLENPDPSKKTIITTIQKLHKFIKSNPKSSILEQEVLFIFDECHRSQLGKMHADIARAFKKHHFYGFTGTPIFEENCEGKEHAITQERFGRKLHHYTIVHAIQDKNVLPFLMHYCHISTDMELKSEADFCHPKRTAKVVEYILNNFAQVTKGSFNAILACASIEMAKTYYQAFKEYQHPLKTALIYSYSPSDDLEDENNEEADKLLPTDKDFLAQAIQDYNRNFGSNYGIDLFNDYYKDVSQRMKGREIDLLIVVNMFLTGFDAPTCNTLWVDKNLRYHGLLQAFSRTNRPHNSVKSEGNIVCFRLLEENLNDALRLFGQEDSHEIVILGGFEETYAKYKGLVSKLLSTYPLSAFAQYTRSESDQEVFINLYGEILKIRNVLVCFAEFSADKELISPRDLQDYQGHYLDLHERFRGSRESPNKAHQEFDDRCVFEMELVRQVEINIDYILNLIAEGKAEEDILRAIKSSPKMRSKQEVILSFWEFFKQHPSPDIQASFRDYMDRQRKQEFARIIQHYQLQEKLAYDFISKAFKHHNISFKGTQFPTLLPKERASFFSINPEDRPMRNHLKNQVQSVLQAFFDKYHDISTQDWK